LLEAVNVKKQNVSYLIREKTTTKQSFANGKLSYSQQSIERDILLFDEKY